MDISNNYTLNYTTDNFYKQEKEDNSNTSNKQEQKPKSEQNLSQEDKRVVYELQARDNEVRAHEAAHQAAGGGMTGGANYSYERGPDGKMYAVSGEVSISIPKGSSPDEDISNAQQVIAAALAPADPSAQDMSVAASARAMMIEAQQEKAKETYENLTSDDKKDEEDSTVSKLDISA